MSDKILQSVRSRNLESVCPELNTILILLNVPGALYFTKGGYLGPKMQLFTHCRYASNKQ